MYVSIEDVNAYKDMYYGSTDPLRLNWEHLEEEDKQVAINRAEREVERLPLHGKPVHSGRAFPRYPNPEESLICAQQAICELSIQMLGSNAARERYDLQAQGVKSYKIGDLSETFADKSGRSGVDEFVYSIVYPFLQKWLSGGYRICPTRIKR